MKHEGEIFPLSLNPVVVYLSSLAPGSRRTMQQSLDVIASILTHGQQDAIACQWGQLRYQHTSAIRSKLIEKYSPATCNKMLTALRQVLKEAQRLELISPEDCAKAIDIKRVKSNALPKGRALLSEELEKLLAACTNDESITGIRDAAMLMILRVGLRRSEVVNLDLWDFDSSDSSLKVRNGKGGKDRLVYLPDAAVDYVCNWVRIRENHSKDIPLLLPISKSKNVIYRRLSDQAVLKIMLGRGKEAGIENFTPHDFRRTFIGELLDAEVDIVTIQKLVGHASPETTSKYDRRGEKTKKAAVGRLNIS